MGAARAKGAGPVGAGEHLGKLIVAGEEFRGHQDNPLESPGGGSDGRAG
jgi:hypothetical protein